MKGKSIQAMPKEETPNKTKGQLETHLQFSDLHCFRCYSVGHIASQCLNKRAMIVVGNNEYHMANDSEGDEDNISEFLIMMR